jgi:putative sigma-54 modulation protein
MNISITARHFKARESYKTLIHERLEKLKRYYEGNMHCDVVLDYRNKIQIAEFRLRVKDKTLIAAKETDKMTKSIDLAIDDLEDQLKKYRGRKKDVKRVNPTKEVVI